MYNDATDFFRDKYKKKKKHLKNRKSLLLIGYRKPFFL